MLEFLAGVIIGAIIYLCIWGNIESMYLSFWFWWTNRKGIKQSKKLGDKKDEHI